MRKSIYTIFSILAFLFIMVSCIHKKQADNDSARDLTFSGDTISISPKSAVLSKLDMQNVSLQEYTAKCTTTGTVKPLSGHLAEVSAPLEGRIVKSCTKLGEKVKAGAPLFEMTSSEYFEAEKTFLQAKQAKQLSEKNYQRKKDITEHGIGSKKELEEAESDFKMADEEYEKAEATLRIFNVQEGDIDMTKPMTVRSPISGEVVKDNITVGQYLKTDAEPVIMVADLDKIWVVARVKENNIGQISWQDHVQVFTESAPDQPINGFVDYIGNIMDEQTRSVEVYIVCDNQGKILKPGMFVTACFEHKLSRAVIIPASAVLQQEDKSYVFLQVGKNKFLKKQVIVSTNGDKRLIVLSGVNDGDVIVAEGGIYLH